MLYIFHRYRIIFECFRRLFACRNKNYRSVLSVRCVVQTVAAVGHMYCICMQYGGAYAETKAVTLESARPKLVFRGEKVRLYIQYLTVI